VIGSVTSSTLVAGHQLGLACVEKAYAKVGATIGIFPVPHEEAGAGEGQAQERHEKSKRSLTVGDRVVLHGEATILPRFRTPEEAAAAAGAGAGGGGVTKSS
ncbi:MAG: hypothetical protein HYZ53_22935, partial [Planctomycetes bacterium]|nr:hypothetical protein [Planctomycetota bacterium]